MAVPPAVVQEVEGIVNGSEPVNTRVTKVLQVLEHHGLCQQQTLLPSQVLCHPSNRGGQMVSHFDVWAKGHQLLSVGLQVQLLQVDRSPKAPTAALEEPTTGPGEQGLPGTSKWPSGPLR